MMKATDLQKILELIHEMTSGAFDHLAKRFDAGAEALGDEYEHLAEFASGWTKLSSSRRRLFVEQVLKSSALLAASAIATKVGLSIASKRQKQLRGMLMSVADLIQPTGKAIMKKGKKRKRN